MLIVGSAASRSIAFSKGRSSIQWEMPISSISAFSFRTRMDCAISSFWRAVSGFTCSYQPSTAGLLPSGVTSVCSAAISRQTGLSTAAL